MKFLRRTSSHYVRDVLRSQGLQSAGLGPDFWLVVLVHNQIFSSRWKHLKGLQELDHRILIVFGKGLKGLSRLQRLSRMSQDRFPESSKKAMVEVGRLIAGAPQPPGQEFSVAGGKSRRPNGLVHIDRLD